jgi:hypothetical protein
MAKKKEVAELEHYFAPCADEANKGWKHLVEYCLDQYQKSKDSPYRSKKLDEIKHTVKVYNQDEEKADEIWDGEANYTIPLTTISLDNLEPRLVSALVGKKPYVAFEMENEQKKDEPTEILESWFNQELEETVGLEKVARSLVHKILQEGTVYPLPYYDIDEEIRRDFVFQEDIEQLVKDDPEKAAEIAQSVESGAYTWSNGILMDLGTAEPVMIDVQESTFEGGRVHFVPFEDVFVADDVDNWEQAPVIRKVYPSYSQLMTDAKEKTGYMNIGPWLYDIEFEGSADTNTASQDYDQIRKNHKRVIECIECSVSYIYQDDDIESGKDNPNMVEERLVAQIALETGVLVRLARLRDIFHKNTHLLRRVRLFPEEGKSYGTSMGAKLESIQKGASKTFNTALNIAEITMIPWFLYTEASGLKRRYKDKGIELKPGKGVMVDDVNAVHFPRFSINPDQMFNWINLWVGFWERLSSIGDLQIGRVNDKNTTATETMAVIQEGNIKHNYQGTSVKDDFLGVIRTLYDLYYQNMPFNKTFLWNGQQIPIPRGLMRRRKKFRLTGSTELSNKLIERKEKEDFYAQSAQDPNINPVKRAEELVKAYGYTETSEWISPNIAAVVEMIMQTPGLSEQVMQIGQQMQQQMAQAPEMEQKDLTHQQDMAHKEDEHEQEMRHKEENHNLDMIQEGQKKKDAA